MKNKFSNKLKFFSLLLLIIPGLFFIKTNHNWQFYLTESIGPNNNLFLYKNLVFDDESIIFNNQDRTSYSLNQKTGSINWQFSTEDYSPFPPTITKDQIFLASFDGSVYSLDKKSAYKIWQFNIDQQYQPDTPIIKSPNKEIVFFGSRNGALHALNSTTGQLIWKKQFKEIEKNKIFIKGTVHFGNIYADEEKIYVFNAVEKKLFAIKQNDGNIIWEINDLSFNHEKPVLFFDTIVLKQEQYLLSIDKSSGDYKKIERIGDKSANWKIFKINGDEQNILILDKNKLIKIDKKFEKKDWALNDIDNVLYSQNRKENPVVEIHNNQIYLQKFLRIENIHKLFAINYDDGEVLWELDTNSSIKCQDYTNQTIFLGKATGQLFAVDLENKEIKWEVKFDGEPIKILSIEDKLLSINLKPSEKITIRYLEQKDGQEIWSYTPDFIVSENDIYINKNMIFILNEDKKIIEKIDITLKNPNDKLIKKINFSNEEVKDVKDPYLIPKQKTPLSWKFKEQYLKIEYLIKNFKNIYSFKINEETKQSVFEISIENDENLYRNKFTDLKIEANFIEKGGKEKIKIKGFYYDHNTWKILFAAPKNANYEYQIRIKSPYFIKNIKGSVVLDKHLAEKLTINQGFFLINDKQVFFPIGMQDIFFDQNYNGNAMDMMSNAKTLAPVVHQNDYSYIGIDDYLDLYQKEAKLNMFRYGVDHWTPALWHSIEAKKTSFSVNGGKFGDTLIEKLKNRDFKIIMTIFGFHPPYKTAEEITKKENQKNLSLYLDYVIARFSPYIDLWELSNEAEAHYLWYEFVINYLKENDPYRHPISTNWETESAQNLDFLSVHWYNPNSTSPGTLSNQISYLKQKYQNSEPKQAILISEFGFKNHSYFHNSSESMRILTWLSIFQKMGIIFWSQGQNGIYNNPENANIYLGPKERSYLLTLNNFLPKNMFLPIETNLLLISDLQAQFYLLENDDFILAYALKFDESIRKNKSLSLNLKKEAKLQWLNPKTGSIIEEKLLEKGEQKIPIPSFDVDLAMKIIYLNTK